MTDQGSSQVQGQQTWVESEAVSTDSSLPADPCQNLLPTYRRSALKAKSHQKTILAKYV